MPTERPPSRPSNADPLTRVAEAQAELGALAERLREDVPDLADPQARALFETAAEVLIGLRTAVEHYQEAREEAFRR